MDLPVPTKVLSDLCLRWKISELGVFGSVVRPDFAAASDVDVVLRFQKDSSWDLFDIVRLRDELATLFGRPVDIVEEDAVQNPYMLASIRKTKRVVYAAA